MQNRTMADYIDDNCHIDQTTDGIAEVDILATYTTIQHHQNDEIITSSSINVSACAAPVNTVFHRILCTTAFIYRSSETMSVKLWTISPRKCGESLVKHTQTEHLDSSFIYCFQVSISRKKNVIIFRPTVATAEILISQNLILTAWMKRHRRIALKH